MVFVTLSCTKEVTTLDPTSTPTPSPNFNTNDRLVFKDFNEFNKTYLMLTEFKSIDELSFWAQSRNHSTLLNSSDSTLTDYSDILKTILNKDSEFELGDSIVLFNNGTLYTYSKKESNKITLKNNPEKYNKVGYIRVTLVGGLNEKTVNLNINSLNAKWQHEFTQHSYQPCGGTKTWADGTRKFVDEIFDETTYYYYVYYSHLYLRIKLEWRGSGGWKVASEQREIHVHVTGSAYWYPGGFGNNTGSNADYYCNSPLGPGVGPVTLPLMNATGAAVYPPYWVVTLDGTISQHVIGDDTNNSWLISGSLW